MGGNNSLALGLHKWININSLSESIEDELTHTWWIVRRIAAWTAKVPDDLLPPIIKTKDNNLKNLISQNILWDGTIINQMNNI